jgi:hypothetical protein
VKPSEKCANRRRLITSVANSSSIKDNKVKCSLLKLRTYFGQFAIVKRSQNYRDYVFEQASLLANNTSQVTSLNRCHFPIFLLRVWLMDNFGRFFVASGCVFTGYVLYELAKEWWRARVSPLHNFDNFDTISTFISLACCNQLFARWGLHSAQSCISDRT